MGPGVGKAVSALSVAAIKTGSNYDHKILLLEEPQNFQYINICRNNNIEVVWPKDRDSITSVIANADIVQLEWWHHPLSLGVLELLSTISIRLTVWSHISGCNYPAIPASFIHVPEHFFFTTAYSLENPLWTQGEKKKIKSASTIACGSGGYENVSGVVHKKHTGFNIGYIGTLDFRKLHPDFVNFCSQVNIENAKFILVGNPDNKKKILNQAHKKKIHNDFEFTGFTTDVKSEFERFDLFGYILNPDHYGTTDNVLLEAMAAGIPIIILNQCGEKYVIKHMKTGMIVKNKKEYGEAVNYMYNNPKNRKKLGENAQKSAFNEFSPEATMQKLHHQYSSMLVKPKKYYNFEKIFGKKPYQWFLSGLGEEGSVFEKKINKYAIADSTYQNKLKAEIQNLKDILKGESKSSIPHFYRYFSLDKNLKYWNNLLSNNETRIYPN